MGNTCIKSLNYEREILDLCKKYGIDRKNVDIQYPRKNHIYIQITKFFFTFNIYIMVDKEPIDLISCRISETILDKTTELGRFKNLETSIDFVSILLNTVHN